MKNFFFMTSEGKRGSTEQCNLVEDTHTVNLRFTLYLVKGNKY